MHIFDSLTVRGKLTFSFTFILALMVLLGGLAVWQLSRVNTQAKSVLAYRLPGVRDSQRMISTATRLRVRQYRAVIGTAEEMADSMSRIASGKADFEKARQDYASAIADATERQLYEDAMSAWASYLAASAKAIAAAQSGDFAKAREIIAAPEATKAFDVAGKAMARISEYNDKMATADGNVADAIYNSSIYDVSGALFAAIVAAVLLGRAIGNSITTPLRAAVKLAERVSAGDLTHDASKSATPASKDEVAQLTLALGAMVTRLRAVVTDVRNGVESVSTASSQIANGNHDLSQRTEEQASNLQQTAGSMEELTSTVRHNADNARAAAQLAVGATSVAERGGKVVGEVVTTMEGISESSRRISEIIGVIDGIAFQTNILALNAAVEAARAGEQGRGFAVVASEVRSLAQRSADAAKEIKVLIHQSVERVESGTKQVSEAGKTMMDIVDQVKRVHDLMGEISAASIEQSQGISQVADAVAQLDQVTQQNAALVEESAAAAESLMQQASSLALTVAVFNVGTSAGFVGSTA